MKQLVSSIIHERWVPLERRDVDDKMTDLSLYCNIYFAFYYTNKANYTLWIISITRRSRVMTSTQMLQFLTLFINTSFQHGIIMIPLIVLLWSPSITTMKSRPGIALPFWCNSEVNLIHKPKTGARWWLETHWYSSYGSSGVMWSHTVFHQPVLSLRMCGQRTGDLDPRKKPRQEMRGEAKWITWRQMNVLHSKWKKHYLRWAAEIGTRVKEVLNLNL